MNISPRVADALGVDVDDGLFDIVVEEHLWNVESTAAKRRMLLEQPQVFFSRADRYLPLRDLDQYESFAMADPPMRDIIPGAPPVRHAIPDHPDLLPLPREPSEPLDVAGIPMEAATQLPPEGFPRFPWPAPQPSVRPVELPKRFYQEAHTLGLFDQLLQEGLRSVGYFDKSYDYVPSGFAATHRRRRSARVDYAMDQSFAIRMHVEQVENGQFLATSNDLPGLVAQGRTVEETLEIAADVARRLLDSYREHGDPLPSKLRTLGSEFEVEVPVTAPWAGSAA